MAVFPGSLPLAGTASPSATLAASGHTSLHNNVDDEARAIATKIGTGASTPASTTVLIGTGAGTSAWSQLNVATSATGILPVPNGGTGVTSSTGTGSVVLGTAPSLSSPTITGGGTWSGSPSLSTPLLTTPSISNFSSAQHDHGDADDGGAIVATAIPSGVITADKLATAPSRFVIVQPAVSLADVNPADANWASLDITASTSATATSALLMIGMSGATANRSAFVRKTGSGEAQDNTTRVNAVQTADSATKAWSQAAVALDTSQSFDYSVSNADVNALTIILRGYWETVA